MKNQSIKTIIHNHIFSQDAMQQMQTNIKMTIVTVKIILGFVDAYYFCQSKMGELGSILPIICLGIIFSIAFLEWLACQKEILAFLPALLSNTIGPPGCQLEYLETSQTFSLITIQISFQVLCLETYYQVYTCQLISKVETKYYILPKNVQKYQKIIFIKSDQYQNSSVLGSILIYLHTRIKYNFLFYLMMNRMVFNNYQSMNLVHKNKNGNQIWLGDYYAASNVQLLKQKQISSVLTSGAMLNINYQKQHNINHKIINAFDIPSYKMTPHFEQAFHFIDDALKRGHILVHCAAGISRSTTFVMVYLLRGQGMTFVNALTYIRNKRSIVNPNYGFQNELKRFQINLKKNKKEDKPYQKLSNLHEKKVVLDFLNEQKRRPMKSQQKFSITYSGINNLSKKYDYNRWSIKKDPKIVTIKR